MNNMLPFLSQRVFNTPLAILPSKAEVIVAALSDRLGITKAIRLDGSEFEIEASMVSSSDWLGGNRGGYEEVSGVALIEISGTLVQKLGTINPYSGMTGYDGIRTNFYAAMNDPKVKAIALVIDSPGGEVAGCFDLVDMIYQSRGEKPIWAILSESAYSAAYAIASACDKIYVPRTGGLGHIGVITCHVDWSRALVNSGIAVTFITYGDNKADGRPELPLSKEAYDRVKSDINAMGELFSETVARNRGVSAEDIRNTQASTYLGVNGVDIGLADGVLSPDAAFRLLVSTVNK